MQIHNDDRRCSEANCTATFSDDDALLTMHADSGLVWRAFECSNGHVTVCVDRN